MHIPRKAVVALLAGVSIAGVAGASAAGFGTTTAGSLGADSVSVASCDSTGVTINYVSAYNATTQRYEVSGVNITNVDPLCNGKAASVTLRNGTTGLATATTAAITVATNAFSMTFATAVDANLVNGVALIISG